ncbi:MAG: hypothetical protein KDD51_13600, partial [Bdellovibrionales bacterium]|nr:hypothetical protein [Bdellovibrionales bacterium]
MQRKKWFKWIGIGLGSLLGLFVVAALLIPVFVDVDKYRPEIVSAAEQHLNGKLELGKLKLSLWGRLRVNVDGFSLSDSNGHKVVAAKDVFFEIPFGSLLLGSPSLTLNLAEPELYVHREAGGELNISQLYKPAPAAPADEATAEPQQAPAELPGIVASARLGLSLRNANLVYEDKKADVHTQVKDFNVVAKNLSLSAPSELEVWAQIDTVVNKDLSIKGPVRFTASAKPETEAGAFKEARVDFKADTKDLEIVMKETFEKPKGVEAWMAGTLLVGTERAACKDLEVRFHNASLKGDGEIRGLKTPPMLISVKVETPSVELAPWKKLIVALRPYDVSGTVGLKANAQGPLEKLDYQADLNVKSASFSGAGLLEKPV